MQRLRRWVRDDPWGVVTVACLSGAAVLGLIALVVLPDWSGDEESPAAGARPPGYSAPPFRPAPGASPGAGLDGDVPPGILAGMGSPLGEGAGFGGDGFTLNNKPKKLVISARSSVSVRGVGYIIPTSAESSYGTAEVSGRTWSLSTDVYGGPDYARVWIQAGYEGVPITCTVSVDGRVTDTRTTSGRYGIAMCQG